MNQEQIKASVDATSSDQQIPEQPQKEEKHILRDYYLYQLRLMCPTMTTDKSDNSRLAILKQRTARLVEMLTLFEHSWTEEVPIIQKACLSYLATEGISKKERQQIIDAWAGWSDFQFKLARYRGLLTQFLQYHHRINQELQSLHNSDNAEESPESQESNKEGGI